MPSRFESNPTSLAKRLKHNYHLPNSRLAPIRKPFLVSIIFLKNDVTYVSSWPAGQHFEFRAWITFSCKVV